MYMPCISNFDFVLTCVEDAVTVFRLQLLLQLQTASDVASSRNSTDQREFESTGTKNRIACHTRLLDSTQLQADQSHEPRQKSFGQLTDLLMTIVA
jgi:hypothetical protein